MTALQISMPKEWVNMPTQVYVHGGSRSLDELLEGTHAAMAPDNFALHTENF